MILGHTDLRINASRANFDAESDFEVHLAISSQKPKPDNNDFSCNNNLLESNEKITRI